jgi:hypothetical protein
MSGLGRSSYPPAHPRSRTTSFDGYGSGPSRGTGAYDAYDTPPPPAYGGLPSFHPEMIARPPSAAARMHSSAFALRPRNTQDPEKKQKRVDFAFKELDAICEDYRRLARRIASDSSNVSDITKIARVKKLVDNTVEKLNGTKVKVFAKKINNPREYSLKYTFNKEVDFFCELIDSHILFFEDRLSQDAKFLGFQIFNIKFLKNLNWTVEDFQDHFENFKKSSINFQKKSDDLLKKINLASINLPELNEKRFESEINKFKHMVFVRNLDYQIEIAKFFYDLFSENSKNWSKPHHVNCLTPGEIEQDLERTYKTINIVNILFEEISVWIEEENIISNLIGKKENLINSEYLIPSNVEFRYQIALILKRIIDAKPFAHGFEKEKNIIQRMGAVFYAMQECFNKNGEPRAEYRIHIYNDLVSKCIDLESTLEDLKSKSELGWLLERAQYECQRSQIILEDSFFIKNSDPARLDPRAMNPNPRATDDLKKEALRHAYHHYYQKYFDDYEPQKQKLIREFEKLSQLQANRLLREEEQEKKLAASMSRLKMPSSSRSKSTYGRGKTSSASASYGIYQQQPISPFHALKADFENISRNKRELLEQIKNIDDSKLIAIKKLKEGDISKIARNDVENENAGFSENYKSIVSDIETKIILLKEMKEEAQAIGTINSGNRIGDEIDTLIRDLEKIKENCTQKSRDGSDSYSFLEMLWCKKKMLQKPSYRLFTELLDMGQIQAVGQSVFKKPLANGGGYLDEFVITLKNSGHVVLHIHYPSDEENAPIDYCHFKRHQYDERFAGRFVLNQDDSSSDKRPYRGKIINPAISHFLVETLGKLVPPPLPPRLSRRQGHSGLYMGQ